MRLLVTALLALAFLGSAPLSGGAALEPFDSYDDLFAGLINLEPDPDGVARVENYRLQRDAASFLFESGTLTAAAPVGGRTCAAVFNGSGTFTFRPPTRVEREHLFRFFERESLQVAFERAAFVFADTTFAELGSRLDFGPGTPRGEPREEMEKCVGYLTDEEDRWLHPGLARAMLGGEPNSIFFAQIETDEVGTIFFEFDPRTREEVRLMRRPKGDAWFRRRYETISLFHRAEDYAGDGPRHPAAEDDFGVSRYDLDVRLDGGLDIGATADLTLACTSGTHPWVRLSLAPDVEIDSVGWEPGKVLSAAKGDDNWDLWVRVDPPLSEGEQGVLRVAYHGKVMARQGDAIYLETPTNWYPRIEGGSRSTFDLRFAVPSKYDFVCAGDKVSEEERDGTRYTTWTIAEPAVHASFNLGFFKEHDIEDERIPPVTILMSETGHKEMKELLIQEGVTSGKHMERQVGADVANAVNFFQNVFGPCPSKRITASEIPYTHGQAFPGLIHLSWLTFQRTGTEGYDEVFRAHEVAHQWWGLSVRRDTYHDQWLEEGFAEYAGLWYMQVALQDNDKFFKVLREYKDLILNNRKYTFGTGQESGPVWLGRRTSTSTTEGDYGLIVYKKGAWILHMLRNMMLDVETMQEEAFIFMMRDFYETYRGRDVSTRDFQGIVEKHFGQSMQWFFDQWVYGTDIPTYKVGYRVAETEDGHFRTTMRVVQEDVPPDFRMFVPLTIRFHEGRFTRLQTLIVGEMAEFDLPLLPLEPEEIVFNDMESVLCRVEDEGRFD